MTTDRSEQSGPEVDVLAVMDAMTQDYAAHIPQFYAQNRKRMKVQVSEYQAARTAVAALLTERASHQQAVEALRERAESAEARLARVAGVLADLRERLAPSADFLADQIAAAIAPQEGEK